MTPILTHRGPRSPISCVTLACALAAALALPGIHAQQPEQSIPCCDSVPIHHLNYGEYTEGCAIGPTGTDVDSFSFAGQAGDVVQIAVRGQTLNLDPRIRLFGPGTTGQLHDTSCSAPFNTVCSNVVTTAPLPASGTYNLIISDSGSDNAGSYLLQIDLLWPLTVAPVLLYDAAPRGDTIDVPTDTDFFAFMIDPLKFFDLFVTGTSLNLDPVVEVLDSTGTVVASSSCSAPFNTTCQVLISFVPGMTTQPGLHFLRIRDAGTDNTGSYQVSLQCLTPPCPNNPLVPCGGATAPLAVSAMEPSVLSSNGGYAGRLLGAGFCSGAPSTTLSIGVTPVPEVLVTATDELHFTVPALAPGVYDLTVTTALATLTLPGFMEVRDAALVADQLFPLGGHGELALRSTGPNVPVIVLADLAPGTTSLGPYGQTQLDLLSPTLLALADPSGIFGSSITCVVTGSSGSWFFRPPVPNVPALSGLLFYCQAFVIDANAANGLFSQTNLATVGF